MTKPARLGSNLVEKISNPVALIKVLRAKRLANSEVILSSDRGEVLGRLGNSLSSLD